MLFQGDLMLYLYLDESGDLGFDFVNKKPSEHFTIAVVAVKGHEQNRALAGAVKVTLWRRHKEPKTARKEELKGSATEIRAKKLFYRLSGRINFNAYAVTINKKAALPFLEADKERIYNYIARQVLERVDLNVTGVRVILTVDRSKTGARINRFNEYIIAHLKAKLDPRIPLEIFHRSSQEVLQLQAADMVAWGVFRKYERRDTRWVEKLREKLAIEEGLWLKKDEERA